MQARQKDKAVNQRPTNLVYKQQKHNALQRTCLLCGGGADVPFCFCNHCLEDLPTNHIACPLCARPTTHALPCANCLAKRPLHINRSFALFRYAYPINLLIQNMKFNNALAVAQSFGRLLARNIANHAEVLPECIIPVPLHFTRLAQRGYNPALEVARPLAEQLGINLEAHSCKRTRPTQAQTLLTAPQRRKNVCNAFSITQKIDYEHVAIIDDVMTTGSTINEFARVLSAGGVVKIDVWLCARATNTQSLASET